MFGDLKEESTTASILVHSAIFPIKIGWSIESKDVNSYTLSSSGSRSPVRLSAQGEEQLNNASASFMLSVVQAALLPESFVLAQNYPNPFNPSTSISFALPTSATVSLTVYNVLGEQSAVLLDQVDHTAGVHDVRWDASSLPSGLYIYRLTAVSNDETRTRFQQEKKLVFMK